MVNHLDPLRRTIHPRAGRARDDGKPPRASSIILGMIVVMFVVMLIAKVLTHLFMAA